MIEAGPGHWRVRYLRTLREVFHLWVDEAGQVRADHSVGFLGLTVLRLHYKLTRGHSQPLTNPQEGLVPDQVNAQREGGHYSDKE